MPDSATIWRWVPAAVLVVGATFTVGVDRQKAAELREPLGDAVPGTIDSYRGARLAMTAEELGAVGVTDYLMRSYAPEDADPDAGAAFTTYVGYYDQQMQGKTIHSPKNCLPGAGWEALQSQPERIALPSGGAIRVNRYLLQRGTEQALVLYWYQGRGRTESNEYVVKLNLLRDAALRGRTEEALVRVMVPVTTSEEDAFALAARVAPRLYDGVEAALPL